MDAIWKAPTDPPPALNEDSTVPFPDQPYGSFIPQSPNSRASSPGGSGVTHQPRPASASYQSLVKGHGSLEHDQIPEVHYTSALRAPPGTPTESPTTHEDTSMLRIASDSSCMLPILSDDETVAFDPYLVDSKTIRKSADTFSPLPSTGPFNEARSTPNMKHTSPPREGSPGTALLAEDGEPGISMAGAKVHATDHVALPPVHPHVTDEDFESIGRLCRPGFRPRVASQAYYQCNKNEDLAANLLRKQLEPPKSRSDPTGAPQSSFTQRRPHAAQLGSFELPPPPMHKYSSTATAPATIASVGNLLTSPIAIHNDDLNPPGVSVNVPTEMAYSNGSYIYSPSTQTPTHYSYPNTRQTNVDPFDMPMPAESQQFLGSALDPNDPRSSLFMAGREDTSQQLSSHYSYNPNYSGKYPYQRPPASAYPPGPTPVFTNVQNPNGQRSLVGEHPTMMPGFNSGHALGVASTPE